MRFMHYSKKMVDYLQNFVTSKTLLSLKDNGYLFETGWISSYRHKKAVDSHNDPIPWLPYPCIDFLQYYLTKEMSLFEFGSGHSSLFYSKHVKTVYAVEHDQERYEKLSAKMPPNMKLFYQLRNAEQNYANAIQQTNLLFDVIVIDGRDRIKCIASCIDYLAESGIILLDNADRPRYQSGIEMLEQKGFKHYTFKGLSPLSTHCAYSMVFFKNHII